MTLIRIEGLTELERALKEAEPLIYKELRKALTDAGKPIAISAEGLALQKIRRIKTPGTSVPWWRFRVGSTTQLVYVVPRERGVKGGPRKRPKFGGLLVERALEPAGEAGQAELYVQGEQALSRAVKEAGLG